jgi:hypothetical protein
MSRVGGCAAINLRIPCLAALSLDSAGGMTVVAAGYSIFKEQVRGAAKKSPLLPLGEPFDKLRIRPYMSLHIWTNLRVSFEKSPKKGN